MSSANPPPEVRAVTRADVEAWSRMRAELWPGDLDGHGAETAAFFDRDGSWAQEVFLALIDAVPVGFAEVSVRPCAEGCETLNVGYIEGWFVVREHRASSVGRALIEAAEGWARSRGCSELASDTEPENERSFRAHLGCGFEDAGLVRCFRKRL